ncbi:MAG: DUF4232 domain-containing protein [Minisyncoccia bacterium]
MTQLTIETQSPVVKWDATISAEVEVRRVEQLLIEEARRRQRRRQRVIAAVVSAAMVGAGVIYAIGSGAASPRLRTTPGQAVALTAFPTCAMTNLHASLTGQGNGTAGTIYYTLKIENASTACTVPPIAVRGYSFSSHSAVGPWSRVDITSSTRATVAHGHAAYVALGVTDTLNYPTALCAPANVTGLLVAASSKRSVTQTVRLAVSVCTTHVSLHTLSPTVNSTGV